METETWSVTGGSPNFRADNGTARRKILLVEDDECQLSCLSRLLRLAGYQVETAHDGLEALTILNRTRVDLIVTDVLMPRTDGLEFVQVVRKCWPALKFIAVSGGGYCEAGLYLDLCLKFGAAHVLEKPFELEKLLEVVRLELGEPSRMQAIAA